MLGRGASADQDARFGNKMKRLKNTMHFQAALSTKVDMQKVKLEVIKPWITE